MASVVLVESYYGGSHRAWADSWVEHSRHDIELLTLPGEYWRWRLRGAAVSLAPLMVDLVEKRQAAGRSVDAVVVSSLIDAASFAGLARRSLGSIPIAVYQHESQLLYPLAPNQRRDSTLALLNWQSLVFADAVWFNSDFHRSAMRTALPELLDQQPTPSHDGLLDEVFAKSRVLWPGVAAAELIQQNRADVSGSAARSAAGPLVLWNQRWDHDKNPQAVFSALAALAQSGVRFRLALAGENQRHGTAQSLWVRDALGSRIVHEGFLPREDYLQLLLRSDVVASAADHEFFGIALVEAMAAGAIPVLPDRLSFPELVKPAWHAEALYGEGELRSRLQRTLTEFERAERATSGLRDSMARFDVSISAASHDNAVDDLIESAR